MGKRPPSQYLYIGFFGLLGLMAAWPQAAKRRKIAKLEGFSWNREDFLPGLVPSMEIPGQAACKTRNSKLYIGKCSKFADSSDLLEL